MSSVKRYFRRTKIRQERHRSLHVLTVGTFLLTHLADKLTLLLSP